MKRITVNRPTWVNAERLLLGLWMVEADGEGTGGGPPTLQQIGWNDYRYICLTLFRA